MSAPAADGATATLIPADALAQDYARVLAAHEAELARDRRRQRGHLVLASIFGLATLALAGTLVAAMPLKRVLPVFVHINADGTYTTTVSQSDVPQPLREATMASTLWLYVTANERFNTATHAEDQQVVYMLSDRATGDTFQARVDARNPESPWRRFGTRTTVRIERISEGLGCAAGGACLGRDPDAYVVRFRRVEKTEGGREVATQRQASVRFHVVPAIPAWQRVTYNPLGLQVVEYSWTDEGSMR